MEQRTVDSLLNELKKFDAHKKEMGTKFTPLMDTIRANVMYQLVVQFWYSKSDTGLIIANELMTLAGNIGYKKGLGNAYNGLGLVYMGKRNYHLAMENYQKAIDIRTAIGDKDGLAWTYNDLGMMGGDKANPVEGIKYHKLALKIREEIGDKGGVIICYGKIGHLNNGLGNYAEALKNYYAALKIAEEINSKEEIAGAYDDIGQIYYFQNNYSEALKYYQKSLKIGEELKVVYILAGNHLNIGNVYFKQKKYDEATSNLLTAIQLYKSYFNVGGMATGYRSLGYINLEKGNYTEALRYCLLAMDWLEKLGAKLGIATVNIEIASVYEKQGKFQEATIYSSKGLEVAKEFEAKDIMKDAYFRLSDINYEMNNYKAAYDYNILYQQMKDSIFNDESASKMKGLEMQYDFDKDAAIQKAEQDKKDVQTQLEIQKQKNIKFRILGGALLLIAFVVGLIFRNRNKQRIKVLEMRQGISRDLHDEIGASLSSVRLMSSFAAESLNGSSPDAKQWMNRIGENTTESMEKIRDIVWTLNSSTDISGNIITRMNQFISHSLEPKDIVCNFISDEEVNDVLSDFVRKRNVYLIFKEAVNNAAKYSEATEVNIKFKVENKKLLLTISDNGKGFDTTIISKGNGLNNMLYRAKQINAILEIKSSKEEGTFISLKMPVTPLRYKLLKKAV